MRLLLVEDNEELAVIECRFLRRENYLVDVATSLNAAKNAVHQFTYHVIILDRRLPDGDGLELIQYTKSLNLRVSPRYLVVSALSDLGQRVEGLDLGADDYIVKPFEPSELLARLRAVIRRPESAVDSSVKVGNIVFDSGTRNFLIEQKAFILPRREMLLLEHLFNEAGRVATRRTLESILYGNEDEIQSNSLESHISKLRKNLSKFNSGVNIRTIRGVGYLLQENE